MLKKTYSPKLAEIEHRWYVLDAAGIPLGRLSSLAARLLMGKHKPTYATHIDTGDFVIVIKITALEKRVDFFRLKASS